MSDQRLGHCLPLYLQNRLLLSALDDADSLPADATEDKKLLAQFRERASDQAVGLLEDLYTTLLGSSTSAVPYRSDRRSQRRTVREQWYMEGRLFRPRERLARSYWNIFLGCLRDKGPAVTFVVGPQDTGSPSAFDELATQVATVLEIDSANARSCFTHKAGYETGLVVSFATLATGTSHKELVKTMKERLDGFFGKFRAQLEAAIDA